MDDLAALGADGSAEGATDTRLIERWLPIAALGEESVRERRSMTALPPIYYLHVWWARRPLIASRAALLASVLPADADRDRFMHTLGIHGDPVAARRKIDAARRTGVRVENPYDWDRAFAYTPNESDRDWLKASLVVPCPITLDPTAGGGSIPFEAVRLGLHTLANDLNPVAVLIMLATVEWPLTHGRALTTAFDALAKTFRSRLQDRLTDLFPQRKAPDQIDTTYLWARTIRCPYCEGVIPLAPNWRLAPDGTGVRLDPRLGTGPGDSSRRCDFVMVKKPSEHSRSTVADGAAQCPFPDCGRPIDGDEIKKQAQSTGIGEQLFAIVFKCRIETKTKAGGRGRDNWERGYRSPLPEDDNTNEIVAHLAFKMEEWGSLDYVPNEEIWSNGRGSRVNDPGLYGANLWRDLFSSRQLLGHGTSVEIFRSLLSDEAAEAPLSDIKRAAFVYLSLALDKLLNYNSRMSVWMPTREVVANTFNRHDFAFSWSYSEMATLVDDLGYDWVIAQTGKCIGELVDLIRPDTKVRGAVPLFPTSAFSPPPLTISCKSADALDHIERGSVDLVTMDPPYYDNVNYSELSDFFYVWLKRTAGHVFPEFFTRRLTDKESEAIANQALFSGQKGAKALAGREYRERIGASSRNAAVS
jgi:putative DNA methylase